MLTRGGNGAISVTAVSDARAADQGIWRALELGTGGRLQVRVVPATEAIGRDLNEPARVVLGDWRLPAAMPHLRELLVRWRGKTTVLVRESAQHVEADAIAALRRVAGGVVATTAATADLLRERLLVPVDLATSGDVVGALASALAREARDLDGVEGHLQAANTWLARGDRAAAFAAAARALVLAPDQPGIVADTARILASLGKPEQAEHVCRCYLAQRPDSVPVQHALQEVLASTPAGSP